MTFLSPYYLIGLAALAVPILIHLLTRDRVRKVAFSTLRFFTQVSKKVLRRKKFREMLLLAMRAAACGLLALAFARPLLRAGGADDGRPQLATARILLVDTSASMARAGVAAAARQAAEADVASLVAGTDAAALITFADTPRVEVPLGQDFSDIRKKVGELAPGHGGTDMVEALRKADLVLRGVSARHKEIVLISDLQRVGWRSFKGDWKLAADTRLTVRAVAPTSPADDLAIVEADYPASTALDGLPRTLSVRIANFSTTERRDVAVTLAIGGRQIDLQKVHIRAGESVPVRFRHVFTTPGNNPGTVAIGLADAVAEDNVYYFNARVIPRIQVTVISPGAPGAGLALVAAAEGSARVEVYDAAFFIEKALAPTADSPFAVKRAAAATVTPADLDGAKVAVLADVKEVPAGVVKALRDSLARGGGILFLPGPEVQADVFNRVFGDIAPCKLKGILRPPVKAGAAATGSALAQINFEHPVFEVFQHPHFGDLSIPRFRLYWEVTDSQLASVPARFDDGRPAVLEREVGGGVSMMLASPADLRWNNFPQRAVFLPYLHQTVRYLAVRSEKRTGYTVGDTLPVPEGAKVTDPRGEVHAAGALVAALPGFYVVGMKDSAETFQYAVNRDLAEADPSVLAADELVGAVQEPEGAIAEVLQAAGASDRDREKDDHGFWWYLVLAVTVLTVSELYVANKTLRH